MTAPIRGSVSMGAGTFAAARASKIVAETAAEAAARLAADVARAADDARRFEHIAAQTKDRFPDLKTGIEDVRKRPARVKKHNKIFYT
jgi:hypothetical protein